jgi:hypothetical protein
MSSRQSNVDSSATTTTSASAAAAISTDQQSSIVDLTPSDLEMAGKRKDAAAHAAAVADVGAVRMLANLLRHSLLLCLSISRCLVL